MEEENKNNSDYVKRLENIVKTLFSSLDSIPLKVAIESISGIKVIDFEKNNTQHIQILQKLSDLTERSRQVINKGEFPIDNKGREFELGDSLYNIFIHAFANSEDLSKSVKFEHINRVGINSDKEFLVYPKFCLNFDGLYVYVTLKTYDKNKIHSERRSFNLTEIEASEITKEALHFVIGFNVSVKNSKIDYAYGWKIIEIGNVIANVKREFNTDNTKMYIEQNILAESSN